ncbi:flagellin lysine-N-methylase [Shewanella intestini]|uniref:Flagellar biosynthesis protein n=1 Tax=Shewanella intestini TaxID=2017544 RepID=A0ABS5I1S5_9GAMM|nr:MULTISPECIES: flagellin lysine-N-methylase [Shewanella]MBR9727978.1 flagellar biosynthesis protein [Shewanella intestini]MRG36471.1 flagellar biosynthesis protein [Shewanella sp. XMDDZSB0408]
MENSIIKPSFVSLFNCIGPECADSCCNDWRITFDKQGYKKAVEVPFLADIAKFALTEIKKDAANWAVVKLDENGACPFLNEQKLCHIHAHSGPQALSYTCKTYPRNDKILATNKYMSMYLSCPEVARIVLFDDAFQFSSTASGSKTVAKALPIWLEKTYDYSLDLLVNSNKPWQQALLAIGFLLKTATQAKNNQLEIAQIDIRHQQLVTMNNNDMLSKSYQELPYNVMPQTHTFIAVHKEVCKVHSRGARPRFNALNQAIEAIFDQQQTHAIDEMNKLWNERVVKVIDNHDELFTRYILYSMYTDHFPMSDTLEPEQLLQQLIIDCFMIRCYLSAMYHHQQGLSQQDVILCFQTYSIVRQHKKKFIEGVKHILSEYDLTSLPAAISLLKTA